MNRLRSFIVAPPIVRLSQCLIVSAASVAASRRALCVSDRQKSAIDRQDHAVDVRRHRRRKENHWPDEFLGLTDAPEWRALS